MQHSKRPVLSVNVSIMNTNNGKQCCIEISCQVWAGMKISFAETLTHFTPLSLFLCWMSFTWFTMLIPTEYYWTNSLTRRHACGMGRMQNPQPDSHDSHSFIAGSFYRHTWMHTNMAHTALFQGCCDNWNSWQSQISNQSDFLLWFKMEGSTFNNLKLQQTLKLSLASWINLSWAQKRYGMSKEEGKEARRTKTDTYSKKCKGGL